MVTRLSRWLFVAPHLRRASRTRRRTQWRALVETIRAAAVQADGIHWIGRSVGREPAERGDLAIVRGDGEGDGDEDDAAEVAHERVLYAAVGIEGQSYRAGDACLLENAADETQPFVGRIVKLWQDEPSGVKMALINWLYRPEDTRKGRQRDHGRHELFLSASQDVNALQSIVGRIIVLSHDDFLSRYRDDDRALTDVFFCRAKYNPLRGTITPVDFTSEARHRLTAGSSKGAAAGAAQKKPRQKRGGRGAPVAADDEDEDDSQRVHVAIPDDEGVSSDSGDDGRPRKRRRGGAAAAKTKGKPRAKGAGAATDVQARRAGTADAKGRRIRTAPSAATAAMQGKLLPPRVLPLVTAADGDVSELAKQRLHVSAVPASLPGREDEFAQVLSAVEGAVQEGTGACVYISGVPGTGKTATVLQVIRHLQERVEQGEVMPFDFVELNGMRLTDPANAYTVLWESLTGKHVTPAHAAELLEKHFSTPSPRRHTCVVLMDELDLLVTRKQTVIYNLFDWPNRKHARLLVIAVANTMDLPERMLTSRVSSRLGLSRITFEPYNHHQLTRIISSRLEGLPAMQAEAVELCARKVASVSGDARRALDVCRRAVELRDEDVRDGPGKQQRSAPPPATIEHVTRAWKEMFASSAVQAVRNSSLHEKVFLCAILAAMHVSGVAETTFLDAAHRHQQLCRMHSLGVPSLSQLAYVCSRLGASRVLLTDSAQEDFHQRLRFNLTQDDVQVTLADEDWLRKMLPRTS